MNPRKQKGKRNLYTFLYTINKLLLYRQLAYKDHFRLNKAKKHGSGGGFFASLFKTKKNKASFIPQLLLYIQDIQQETFFILKYALRATQLSLL